MPTRSLRRLFGLGGPWTGRSGCSRGGCCGCSRGGRAGSSRGVSHLAAGAAAVSGRREMMVRLGGHAGLPQMLSGRGTNVLTKGVDENTISIALSIERNSRMNRGDLADLTAFVAVADHLSFRRAASRLGVTPSALSHSMRQLEERLGMRLLNRTTRSVSVTDAGLRLLERLRPAISENRRRARGLEPRAPAARGPAADLCDPSGSVGGHRADLEALLVDVIRTST